MANNPHNSSMMLEEYSLKRLVYINSASHAYSEIMLDSHMALFGKNNAGKTASLAGTKLLLFPEVDFHRCDSKFRFKGKTGYYSMEESYDFYFPDSRSFIVLEVSNPEGFFCMVLYKTKNYGYGRFFIPVEYSQMRGVFWDSEKQGFAEHIGVSGISQFSKENKGLQLTDSREIASLMFSSYRDTPARKRFCVLPLKDDRKESTDAFRNIYQLAFETGQLDIKTLPNAIAALLEMGRSRNEERLDANLIELSEQHAKLYEKGEWLQELSNLIPCYQRTKGHHKMAVEVLSDYSKIYLSIQSSLNTAKNEHAPASEKNEVAYSALNSERQNIKLNQSENHKENIKVNAIGKKLTKDLIERRKKLDKAKGLKGSYGSMSLTEILTILDEGLFDETTKLNILKAENGQVESLKNNLSRVKQLNKEIADRTKWVSSSDLNLLRQLNNVDAADILHTINPLFGDIAVKLGNADKQSLYEFTQLFVKSDNGDLSLLGAPFNNTTFNHFDLEQKRSEWEKEIDDKTGELYFLNKEIKQNQEARTQAELACLIEKKEGLINDFQNDIKAITGIDTLAEDIEQLKIDLDTNNVDKTHIQQRESKLDADFKAIDGPCRILQDERTELKGQVEGFRRIEGFLIAARKNAIPNALIAEPLTDIVLSENDAINIIEMASNCNTVFNDFRSEYTILSENLPHPDLDVHKALLSLSDYDEHIRIYNSAFETLEYDFIQQKDAVQSHNQLFNNQVSEIKDSALLLKNFVSDINKDLNQNNHVSNLSSIKLHIDLHPAFLSLLSTLDKHDIQGDSLLAPQLYEGLSKFVAKFFNKKSRRLKMADIISEMVYHYRLEETGELVTKGQSGGTTSAITSFVLSVLLNRITPPHVQLKIPIIVDEIGTLDSSNTDSTIKQITEHGFSIFCATPNYSASVSHKVGRWVMIDKSMVKTPLVQNCHLNILPDHVESFGEH